MLLDAVDQRVPVLQPVSWSVTAMRASSASASLRAVTSSSWVMMTSSAPYSPPGASTAVRCIQMTVPSVRM